MMVASVAQAIPAVLRLAYRPPWWLEPDARIAWDAIVASDHDVIDIRGQYIRGFGPDADFRYAVAGLDGRLLRAATSLGDGALVDLVVKAMGDVLVQLRPHTPSDLMLDLAMQAIQDAGAREVLVDALLEDGTLMLLPESRWSTPESTRHYYAAQARRWAEVHVAERWAA